MDDRWCNINSHWKDNTYCTVYLKYCQVLNTISLGLQLLIWEQHDISLKVIRNVADLWRSSCAKNHNNVFRETSARGSESRQKMSSISRFTQAERLSPDRSAGVPNSKKHAHFSNIIYHNEKKHEEHFKLEYSCFRNAFFVWWTFHRSLKSFTVAHINSLPTQTVTLGIRFNLLENSEIKT